MVLLYIFGYMGSPFQEVSGHIRELLTLDAKERMKDDVEQKRGIL